MPACLRILVPDDTTNYIQNPALRYDTTGWNASAGASISRSSDCARFNIASLKVVTTGLNNREGAYYRVNSLQGISEPITVSAYVRGNGRVHIRLIDNPVGKEWVSPTTILRSDRWVRIEVSGFSTGTSDMRLYVETDNKTQIITFYVDGGQMERHPYATTYCDGDQPGCRWSMISHASLSTRSAFTRMGGKWVDLGGTCRDNDDIYFTVAGGLGMASLVNNIEQWPKAPGAYYDNTKIVNRVMTFTFFVKHKKFILSGAPTLEALHRLRQELIDVFKSDRTQNEPFLLEYSQGDRPVYIWARYEGGLEGEWDLRNPWINSFPVRLISVDPFFFEDDREIYNIDFQDSAYFNGIAGRIDGSWNRMNYGFLPNVGTVDGPVMGLELGERGQLWSVGSFRYANANVNAIDPMITAEGISYWNGTKWTKISAGANAVINAVDVAPNGYVYVTGAFSTIGGVAANGVAYWDGASWNAMGTGISGVGGSTQGFAIKVAPNGDVFLGGYFLSVGGKNCRMCARWSGGSWYTIGAQGGFDSTVTCLAISPDGSYVYFGGGFLNEYGLVTNLMKYMASCPTTTYLLSVMGGGFDAAVRAIAIDQKSGAIYCCGQFTVAGASAYPVNKVARWSGSAWMAMGSGANANVISMAIAPNGDVIVGGPFTIIGNVACRGLALWNGSAWVNLDLFLSIGGVAPGMNAIVATPNGDIFVSGSRFSNSGVNPSVFSGITIIPNGGTAEVRPVIYIVGSGRLRWIENQSTGKRIFLDLTVFAGEEVFIDFEKGTVTSPVRGDLISSLLPGSDFSSFSLIPGNNKIAVFMSDDVNASMKMYYDPIHWSADAVETAEAL